MKVFQSQIQEIQPRLPCQEISYFIRRPAVIEVLRKKGIKYFFPIQYQTFDHIKFGSDLIGRDKTGSGKTIAYTLPIIQRLRNQQLLGKNNATPKFLIILPTRELAIQVKNQIQSLRVYPQQIKVLAVYGGTPIWEHVRSLQQGVDILAATPGRLIDLLTRGNLCLKELQAVCLDQADQMLKQGFHQDIEKILQFVNKQCPYKTQKLLFSATVPKWVQQLAAKFMQRSKVYIDLLSNCQIKTPKTISHLSVMNNRNRRTQMETIQNLSKIYAGNTGTLIIFCQTKREANQIYSTIMLPQEKSLLHGDIPQAQRQYTFKNFKEKKIKCLIATNVAARGLDIPSVDLIIQLQPPRKVDDYVHRAGRTARAGKSGVCITFYNQQQRYLIREISRVANIKFTEIAEPSQADVMKATSKELIQHIKNIDQGLVEYFEDAAKQLINQVGAEKALALALAQISGIKTPPKNYSIQSNAQGYISYAFSGQGETTNRKDLVEYLSCNLQRFSENDMSNINNLTVKTVVFDMKENFKKKMQALISTLEKKDNILDSIYKLRVLYNKQNLQDFKDDEDDITWTQEEYQEAIYNKNTLEVVVKGFGSSVNEDTLFRFFKDNQIRPLQMNLLKNENGSTGIAFVLLLNQTQKQKALQLNSHSPKLQNRMIIIEQPKRR